MLLARQSLSRMGSAALPALAALVLQIVVHTCTADAGVILVNPSNRTVPVNTTTSFFCKARGLNAGWYINSHRVDDFNKQEYINKGFTFHEGPPGDSGDSNHIHNLNVTVVASVGINNTNFHCFVYLDRATFSDRAELIVMGGPATPNVSLDVVNATTLQLSWNPPFTWPGYEILRYTVMVENRSSGITVDPVLLPPTDLTYTLTASAPVQHCAELRFNVTASNALGDSAPAVVTGGFPKVPVFHSQPTYNIIFQQDGTPNLELEFGLPQVCPYQELSYTITLQRVDVEGDAAIALGRIIVPPYPNQWSASVQETIRHGLVMGARYSVGVSVNTSGGMSTSSQMFFVDVTLEIPTTTQGVTTGERITITTSMETMTTEDDTVKIALISSFVVVIILILAVILTLITIILLRRRYQYRSRRASISKSKCLPMVPNPIYAGPVYETVTQNISSLPNQNFAPPSPYGNIPTSPAAELSLDSKFTHFNPEAALQCNENATVPTEIISSSVMNEDNYTVMRSPTSTAPPVQPQCTEHENTTMRYVQDPTVTDL